MRMLRTVAVSTLLLLAAAGCGAPDRGADAAEPSTQDAARVEQEIRALFEEYSTRIKSGDWHSTVEFYSDDPRFYWSEPGRGAYDSKQAVSRAIESASSMIERMEVSAQNLRVTVLSDRHAVVIADMKQRFTFTAGGELETQGVLTAVLQREETGWKFLNGQVASLPGPQEN